MPSIITTAMASVSLCQPVSTAEPSLSDLYQVLAKKRYVDRSHSIAPGIPHYKGFDDMSVRSIYTVAKDGFQGDEYCHVGGRIPAHATASGCTISGRPRKGERRQRIPS
jgi:hypothetical protein